MEIPSIQQQVPGVHNQFAKILFFTKATKSKNICTFL